MLIRRKPLSITCDNNVTVEAGEQPRLMVDDGRPGVFLRLMKADTTTMPARPLGLANLLTYGRIAAVPVVVAIMYAQSVLEGPLWLRWVALAVFIVAGVTDFFDGYVARMWSQQSSLGRMLDPIADKLLVASCLLMLAVDETIKGPSLIAAVIILCREILVSGMREYLAELRVRLQVTQLAKWKTTLQLVAIGFLIAGEAGDRGFASAGLTASAPDGTGAVTLIGIILLWLSAVLTLYTGWDYMRAGLHHLVDE